MKKSSAHERCLTYPGGTSDLNNRRLQLFGRAYEILIRDGLQRLTENHSRQAL